MKRGLLIGCLLLAGCDDTAPEPPPPDLAPGPLLPKNKVDVLFLLGNEASTSAEKTELRNRFPQLVQIFESAGQTKPASYHFGVIDPDLGAGQVTLGNGQCHPGGDGAKLQAIGAGADPACKPPAGGARYLDYDQIQGTNNLPPGQDLATTFSCMANLGDLGCGFQQQLEAVYQALHDPIPENAGFVRDDALLVVVFVVDKDDCSLPSDTDIGDGSQAGIDKYGPLSSFRCIQFGVACGNPSVPVQPVDSNGPLSMCRPMNMAEGSKLIDVQKYIDYFTRPSSMGGVKADPRDVIVAAIAAPLDPFRISVFTQGTPPVTLAYVASSCSAGKGASPPVRLSAVVDAVPNSQRSSICSLDFQSALDALGQAIVSRL